MDTAIQIRDGLFAMARQVNDRDSFEEAVDQLFDEVREFTARDPRLPDDPTILERQLLQVADQICRAVAERMDLEREMRGGRRPLSSVA